MSDPRMTPGTGTADEAAGSKEKNILSIRGLSKAFGRTRVLDRVDLDVREGSVLGLMGENGAGKSTMMKCLFGITQRDDGKIFLSGREVHFSTPREALENGIAMVHQELNQCLELNVLDNLFLGRFPKNAVGAVDEARMEQEAAKLFRQLNMTVKLKVPMKTMSVSERQMVEIAKAISYDAKLIVLDEPTSSLTIREVNKLFEIMNALKARGVSFIYISHKMDEIFEICDQVAVLRDGRLIWTKDTRDTGMNELIAAMVGRPLTDRFPPVDNTPGKVVLSLERLCTRTTPRLRDVTFGVREGEIFGLYGLVGSGRSEILETIFGLIPRAAGRVLFRDRLMDFAGPEDAIAAREIRTMRVKCIGPSETISALSGGNQQKVIFGRWLEREPDVFLMDEPTRGIDVGAKYEIYELILRMAKKGKTVIVVSSEMPEILGITNRIGVMSNGTLAGIVDSKSTSQEELLELATEYL